MPADVRLSNGVQFSWGASTGVVEGYRIYWGTEEGGPYPFRLCDVEGDVLEHKTGLDDKQVYYLICRAYNEYGESGDSNSVVWPN